MSILFAKLAPHLLTLIEFILLAAALGLIYRSSRTSSGRHTPNAFRRIEGAAARLARHKNLSVVVVGASVIVIRVALIPVLGIPQPASHDEFSYLLAADTFAHGRMTNPTHPMWIHFESFHINQRPTYMSMYPPAQGLVLALGQLLGNPWIGQLLATAFMCSALCWMLQAWVPLTWALLGAALAVLRLGVLCYWINGYWSASIVAFAGALVLGACPRMRTRYRVRDSLLMGIGLVILANSRPFEGLLFSVPVAAAMLWSIAGSRRRSLGASLSRIVLPVFVVLVCGALATGYYYYRVTGNPFRMSYQVNRDTYSTVPYFLWQTAPPEPVYHHAVMRDFYRSIRTEFDKNFTLRGYLWIAAQKAYLLWLFFLGPLLTLPFLAFPWILRQTKMRLPLAIVGVMFVGFAVETWTLPHYFSPAVGALYIILVQCMRELWYSRVINPRIGPALVRSIPALACAMILLRVSTAALNVPIESKWPRGNLARAEAKGELSQMPGKQLVLVRYGPNHRFDKEWVANDADIDHSKVVWARDMGDDKNLELLRYFRDRTVWRVNGDASPAELEFYRAAGQ